MRVHVHARVCVHAGASWYLVAGHDIDLRGVLGLLRTPERMAATACALDLLRLALRPHTSSEAGGGNAHTKASAAATAAAAAATAAAANPAGAAVGAAAAALEAAEEGKERGAGTVAAAKNIAGLEAGALLRVPRRQLVLQVYSADGACTGLIMAT